MSELILQSRRSATMHLRWMSNMAD